MAFIPDQRTPLIFGIISLVVLALIFAVCQSRRVVADRAT